MLNLLELAVRFRIPTMPQPKRSVQKKAGVGKKRAQMNSPYPRSMQNMNMIWPWVAFVTLVMAGIALLVGFHPQFMMAGS